MTGNYYGAFQGTAQVQWQRLYTGGQARYQFKLQLKADMLPAKSLTSQGLITENGLVPQVYEELLSHRRDVRIGTHDIILNNGQHVPRPDDVQDFASQVIELAHRFATGQVQFTPGGSVHLWIARTTGVDEWVYDMLGRDTIVLPHLGGTVQTIHLKPRRLNRPDSPLSIEIWLAPDLQYLPVRLLITQGVGKSADLRVDTIRQE